MIRQTEIVKVSRIFSIQQISHVFHPVTKEVLSHPMTTTFYRRNTTIIQVKIIEATQSSELLELSITL